MEALRGAENDANNSFYEDSRAKIEAVRSVVHQKESMSLGEMSNFDGNDPQDIVARRNSSNLQKHSHRRGISPGPVSSHRHHVNDGDNT